MGRGCRASGDAFGVSTQMSSNNVIGQEASLEEQAVDQADEAFAVVEETPELLPSVKQEIQGKVDTNHPDATPDGLTLEAEERLEAREWEIERTRRRFDSRQDSGREARARQAAGAGSKQRRFEFAKRAASVDRWCDPEEVDPRAQLLRAELGAVNQEAARLAEQLRGWSQAAVSRRLAERVADGAELESVVLEVFEEFLWGPGQVIPIGAVSEVPRGEVSIEGRIETLWDPSHPSICQVGLIEDDSGAVKFTSWRKSDPRLVQEGDLVRMDAVKKNWYKGRCSVAVTYWSDLKVLDRHGERQG